MLGEKERETETERERDTETDRSHCRAKIGNEFTLSLAKIRTSGDEYQVANAITTINVVVSRQATTAPEAVSGRAATIGSWRPTGFKQMTTIAMTAVFPTVETLTIAPSPATVACSDAKLKRKHISSLFLLGFQLFPPQLVTCALTRAREHRNQIVQIQYF